MLLLTLGGSAVVPSLLLLWYVYTRDRNPEPGGLVLRTFLLGALICLPVVPVATALESAGADLAVGMWSGAAVKAFLGAAIPEELFKFLVLVLYVWRKPDFDEPMDGMVYGATASLGFATLENLLYVGQSGMGTAVVRALTAVPCHAFTGIIMGAFVGRARFAEPGARLVLLVQGLGSAILLHGFYDCFLMTESGYAFLAFGVLWIELRWGRRLIRALSAEQQQQSFDPFAYRPAQPALALAFEAAPSRAFEPGGGARFAGGAPARSTWGWFKLWMGALGLSACGVWWLGVAVVLSDGGGGEPLEAAGKVGLVLVSLVPTALGLLLFRSGLRVPAELPLGLRQPS